MEEVEMLFPLTSPIPGVPNWSVDGVISHAKLECEKPLVWHVYLEFPCRTKYSMDILCFTVILFAVENRPLPPPQKKKNFEGSEK